MSVSKVAMVAGAAVLVTLAGMAPTSQVASAEDGPDLERGRAVYDHWCMPCHAPGPGHPGTQSLQLKYDGNLPAVLTEREDLTPDVIRTFVRQGVLSMAPFRKTEITDEELDGMAAWLTGRGQ